MPEATETKGGQRPWATLALSLICTVAFVVSWAASGFVLLEDGGRIDLEQLRSFGALDWLALREQAHWWRLFSAPFLHGAWWHLAFNLWALFVLGGSVERLHGRRIWLLVALSSALCSGLAAMAWGRADMVVGVSGVVFGYGGFLLGRASGALLVRSEIVTPDGTQRSKSQVSKSPPAVDRGAFEVPIRELSFWLGLSLAAGWLWPELSQAGHVGGLLAGLVTGAATSSRLAIALGIAVLAGSTSWAAVKVVATPEDAEAHERLGYALLARERAAEAWPHFDDALELVPQTDSRRGEWLNASAYARAIGSQERLDWERGLVLVKESLEEAPEDPNRLDTWGWLLCRLGEVDQGLVVLRRAEVLSAEEPSEDLLEHLEGCHRR